VGDTLRQRLENHARNGWQIRNVFLIFVVLMQNIIRYSVDDPQPGSADSENPLLASLWCQKTTAIWM
jgi:hypothetical protein